MGEQSDGLKWEGVGWGLAAAVAWLFFVSQDAEVNAAVGSFAFLVAAYFCSHRALGKFFPDRLGTRRDQERAWAARKARTAAEIKLPPND
jgi:hypothetical protein